LSGQSQPADIGSPRIEKRNDSSKPKKDVWVSTENARVLVYSNAGLLQDQTLVYGDNQFLLEIESLDQPLLAFIHAGGWWFFTGLSGYVV